MKQLARPTMGKATALATLFAVVFILFTSGGKMFSPGALNAQSRGDVVLGGVRSHAEIAGNCSACHVAPWSGETMATRCLSCHSDVKSQLDEQKPMHGQLTDGMKCRNCHTEHKGPHAAMTDLARFDHNCAAFKLTGKHVTADCKSCHKSSAYKETPQSCVACHAEPQTHKGKFGTACADCHGTTTFKDAVLTKFDHNSTTFKLTGKHLTVDCKSCHKSTYKGTPQTCVACHAEPQVHVGKYGTACADCHSTATFKDAVVTKFDHNRAAFKLTGKHVTVDCKSCHKSTFKGTPQTCVACHAEPQSHKGKYGAACASCHSTTTFKDAVFKHKFPLNHGKRRAANECTTCHKKADDFKTYTCYGCHEHQPDKIERKHTRKGIKKFDDCARCHSNGRERRRAEASPLDVCPGHDQACAYVPATELRPAAGRLNTDDLLVAALVLREHVPVRMEMEVAKTIACPRSWQGEQSVRKTLRPQLPALVADEGDPHPRRDMRFGGRLSILLPGGYSRDLR
jgi:hypothetical protein